MTRITATVLFTDLGDGIVATFSGASDGVAAAVAIQRSVDRLNRSGQTPA